MRRGGDFSERSDHGMRPWNEARGIVESGVEVDEGGVVTILETRFRRICAFLAGEDDMLYRPRSNLARS